MMQLNAAPVAATARWAMETEAEKLHRDLERYRFLLTQISDPRAVAILTELVKEAEARLAQLERGDGADKGPG